VTSSALGPFARAAADANALRDRTGVDRFAAVVVLGSGLLWIVIPIATFWLASRVTSDSVRGVLFALLGFALRKVSTTTVITSAPATAAVPGGAKA